jgi:hypothetical protein
MANKAAWECVDKLCRCVMNIYDKPFGGIPFIGLRDFRPFTLTTFIRSDDDPEYTSIVDDIGEDCSGERRSLNMITDVSQLADAVYFLFPPYVLADPFTCLEHAFLSPRNTFVDEFNDFVLNTLPGDYGASLLPYESSQSCMSIGIILQFRHAQRSR